MKKITDLLNKLYNIQVTKAITKVYEDALARDIFGNNSKKKSVYISKTKNPSTPRLVDTGDLKSSFGSDDKGNIGFADDKVKVQALISKYKASYFTLSKADKAKLSREITAEMQKLLKK